jgi:hypothetical protein
LSEYTKFSMKCSDQLIWKIIIVGKEDPIQEVIQGLRASGFNLKVESSLKDYLSCRVIEDLESKSILILQPHLINNLEAKFGQEVCNKRVYKTPGTPRLKIVCPATDDDVIDVDLQGRYWSSVGMLLYLIKYSRPDLCNVFKELAKFMDKATKGTYLEMLRVVKFVIDTKNFCLRIKPEFKGGKLESTSVLWQWLGWWFRNKNQCDMLYFVSHECTCLLAVKVAKGCYSFEHWGRVCGNVRGGERSQVHILLSLWYWHWSWVANDCTDNVGAMFMAQNSSSGVRTRHVDTRYHCVQENLDDGIIKIEFIKSVENQSDIFTKNVTQEIYERHVETFLKKYIEGEFNGWTLQYRKGIGNILYVQAN